MGRKKRNSPKKPAEPPIFEAPKSEVPKFEIGVKGDEFDLKFTRAANEKTAEADNLLRNLSKETRVFGYNFLNFAVLAVLLLVMALSFAFLSREDAPPKLSAAALADGSYTANLSKFYKDSLPLGDKIRTLGARLGFCDMPKPEEAPPEPEEPETPPATEASTEPTETTLPPTSDLPTSAPITEPEEVVAPDTFRMFANATANIRLAPDPDSMIMGYFAINEEVDVIRLDDGWAEIWYNGMTAYVSAEYLGESTVIITEATTEPTTEETEPETEPTEETTPDESDILEPEETETREARSTIRARFPTGGLTVEKNPLKINGIGIGDTIEEAKEAFYLTEYDFTPNCRITVMYSEEEGGARYILMFSNNIVVDIQGPLQ